MKRGFTLLEVVVSMTILGLLAGSIFAILWRTGEEAAEIQALDTRDEEVARFFRLMRQTIESLPEGAEMTMTPPSESVTGYHEMTIGGAMSAFAFGENVGTVGETTIALRPQADDGLGPVFEGIEEGMIYEVAISREDFGPQDSDNDGMVFRAGGDDNTFLQADEEGRYWLPILSDVTALSWRFWDEDNRDWLDEWTNDEQQPAMMELSLLDPYRGMPLRIVLDVPDHLVNPPEPEPAEAQPIGTIGNPVGGNANGGGGQPQAGRDGQRPGDGDGARGEGRGRPEGGGDRGRRPGGGDGRGNGGDGRRGGGQGGGQPRGGGPGQGGGNNGGGGGQGGGGNNGGGGQGGSGGGGAPAR